MKILFAADNRYSSYETLKRFLIIYGDFYTIQIAGYSLSLQDLSASWNLDALLDFTQKSHSINIKSANYTLLAREIQKFKPDLVISDLEPYCSNIAIEQGIKLWQVSPMLLYYAIKNQPKIAKFNSSIVIKSFRYQSFIQYLIRNSDKNLVLSHLGDIPQAPILSQNFSWARPNFIISPNKDKMKACGIRLADIYYGGNNNPYYVDYSDAESIICSTYHQQYALSQEPNVNEKIPFLSQYLSAM